VEIELSQSGGFAPVPVALRHVVVRTEQLQVTDSTRLVGLVDDADLDAQPAVNPPPAGAADYRTFTLTVTREGTARTIRFTDLDPDPALAALVGVLSTLAAPPATPSPSDDDPGGAPHD